MNVIQKIAIIYLICLFLVGWGYAIGKYKVFPYYTLEEVASYIKGGEGEDKQSLVEKITNDLDLSPQRLLVTFQRNPERDYQLVNIPDLNPRRNSALIFQTEQKTKGHRVIWGTIDFQGHWHGALLLNEESNVIHTWKVHERNLGWDVEAESNTIPHGFEILPDGSIIVNFDNGRSIQRFDWCGRRVWATEGRYSHSIYLDDQNSLWSLDYPLEFMTHGVTQLDVESGKVLRKLPFLDIMAANPSTDILGIQQKLTETGWEWIEDYWHPNDAEPLSRKMAHSFENFSAGDLLISVRNLNLIFIVDPETLKIKWWRSGETRRQHDPDWQPNGKISVYDNNMHRKISRIKQIDPETYSSKVLFDGKKEGFYSFAKGKHQVLENGNILITISQQGRVIEVTPAGDVVFEFINSFDMKEHKNIAITGARVLPQSFFEFESFSQCK